MVSTTTSDTSPRPSSVTCTLVSAMRLICSSVPASSNRPASTAGKGFIASATGSASAGRRQLGCRVHSNARPSPTISALVSVSLTSCA
ncbi:hypothetical protein D3C72_1619140 [compost metagenome]